MAQGRRAWRNSARHSGFPVATPVNFTNVAYVCRRLELAVVTAPQPVRLLVLGASGVIEIDYTSGKVLSATIASLRRRGISVAVARLSAEKARREAEKTGLLAGLGADHDFLSVVKPLNAIVGGQAARTFALIVLAIRRLRIVVGW